MYEEEKKLTAYGRFMYKLCDKTGQFFWKHKVLFWIMNLTWNLPMTIVGFLTATVLLIIGKKPTKYRGLLMFKVGVCWGGLSLGFVIIRDNNCMSSSIEAHESGHAHQVILGPLFPILVAIPSAIRYWVYALSKSPKFGYDDIWFEKSATELGDKLIKKI